jgi:hypothetical protein
VVLVGLGNEINSDLQEEKSFLSVKMLIQVFELIWREGVMEGGDE